MAAHKILSSVACNLDRDILAASLPLLEESKIEAIEWSFDALFKTKDVPQWFLELLHTYSAENRLIGHGVFYSLFSGRWLPEQTEWLEHLKQVSQDLKFSHVTEHFGFMTGKDFHHGAPLPVPYNSTTLAIGRDRLTRMQDACQCPVGLENLAFSYSLEEVKIHGQFLAELILPVNGFIILDLHNLYCQLHNFQVTFDELIRLYPLHLVREIHISGGSWTEVDHHHGKKIRRDTHDDAVPAAVFSLLTQTIPLCPNLMYVVLEQLGNGLHTHEQRKAFYHDFISMEKIVDSCNKGLRARQVATFTPPPDTLSNEPIFQSESLYAEQLTLSSILENAADFDEARQLLCSSSLANSSWQIENWQPDMIITAMAIAQKWKKQ